jgi:hypothetical protein
MGELVKAVHEFLEEIRLGFLEIIGKPESGINKDLVIDRGHNLSDKPKRARGKMGRYLADDPTTKDVNEAWVGGKAPKKRKK